MAGESPTRDHARPGGRRRHRGGAGFDRSRRAGRRPRIAPAVRAAVRQPVAPPAPEDRPGRPREPRCLPRLGRLCRTRPGDRDRPGRGDSRGPGLQAHGPRRRGVPHGTQVGRRGEGGRPAPLRGLQCRRVGARHVQGPRPDGGRSVRRAGGDDDRGLRDRERARVSLHARGVSPRGPADGRGDRRGPGRRLARREHPGRGLLVRRGAPPRRGRLYLRRGDGALQLDRGQARRAAQQAAVPGAVRAVRQADGHQQRRDAGEHPADPPAGRRGLRRHRDLGVDRAEALLRLRARRAAGRLRGRFRHHPRRR